MSRFRSPGKKNIIIAVLLAAALIYGAVSVPVEFKPEAGSRTALGAPEQGNADAPAQAVPARLPEDQDFKVMAESDALKLKLDEKTGHFIIEDKRTGSVHRSYPEPKFWAQEKISENWKKHLASPLMVQYVDFSKSNVQAKETNLAAEGGQIKEVKEIPGGFSLVYELPATGFRIPVEVTLQGDYIQTRIPRDGIRETKMGLIWVRLYPFFGAEYSAGQDGYMFIPDGAGALIRYKENGNNVNKIYDESVYGQDQTFAGLGSNRNKIIMPVFGMKTGGKGFLAVLHEGEEYANIVAAPAGVLSGYNWVTAQMNYRASFLQFTSRNSPDEWGYVDYNRDELFGSDRVVRYYILGPEKAGYVGMAQTYREYLMKEKGIKPRADEDKNLPLHVDLIGGDREEGVVSDRYIKLTDTSDASRMVDTLTQKGVPRMSLTYMGWQKGGYSSFGRSLPADSSIGGSAGMKSFIDKARGYGYPVYLDTELAANNTGGGGFDDRFHAKVNLAGRNLTLGLLYNGERVPAVSDKFAEKSLEETLPDYKELGVSGIVMNGIGQRLYSDYNTGFGAPRDEARDVQERVLGRAKESLGSVKGTQSNFYALPYLDHIRKLVYDHSYDLFTDEPVPFAQITLHGLVSYSSEYVNNRQEDVNDFLRDIEYGAEPSFIFTQAQTQAFVNAYGIRYYNTYFPAWENEAAEQYKRYNEALGPVQNQFITNHRTLAPGVKETTYANGRKLIVNYNREPYQTADYTVPAQNFAVVGEGGGES
ncbi:DUF5696 domain-containing protein [Paenibacillus caseinilyticus]|uniref:Uncharacterized protein n=1 Tax=Paenibacillus mucilaginosus K02 TaxID=997761 RepID=I0BLJ3_9BACL|nr:DUF5696 domain-containing protein [Paenibacillus mucilaginosus]AFH63240.1 hypothetical protein B2K_21465 [Paenibacillus mucilaginosus K02]AFK65249.1 hypothetical protein [Paenibacillus mucilaginosus K02]